MNNFPVLHNGETYWISRSIAVTIKFTAIDQYGNEYVLATRRGEGTPDPEFVGSWCMPCGYLDYNETTKEAAARELKEETGIEISPDLLILVGINDNPNDDKRQNIGFRFRYKSNKYVETLEKEFTTKFSEENEVSNIKFIPISEIDNYRWAFNHKELARQL